MRGTMDCDEQLKRISIRGVRRPPTKAATPNAP